MRGRLSAAVALCVLSARGPAAHAVPLSCPPVEDAGSDGAMLPHAAAALHAGGILPVLAVGLATAAPSPSGTTTGVSHGHDASSSAQASNPTGIAWQMAHALETSIKGLHVTMTAVGGRGLSSSALLDRLRAELPRHSYKLILWQTGTVDAVDLVEPDAFYGNLSDGASVAHEANADLILIDPQWSRFLEANANVSPYLSAMQAAGALPGVALFDRYEIMRDWASSGAIDLEQTPASKRQAEAARLHTCLGRALADLVMRSGRSE